MPWNYCVTFRIADKTVNGKTYDERRASLVENARAEKMGFWDETKSFILVESNEHTPNLAARICKGLSAADDMVVVFDPTDLSATYFGVVRDVEVLRSFFPEAEKTSVTSTGTARWACQSPQLEAPVIPPIITRKGTRAHAPRLFTSQPTQFWITRQ